MFELAQRGVNLLNVEKKTTPHPHGVGYCLPGSLEDLLMKRAEQFSLSTILGFCRDAAAGIANLHTEGLLHRDIALRCAQVGRSVYLCSVGPAMFVSLMSDLHWLS